MNNAILPVDVPSLQPARLQLSLCFTGDSFYDGLPVQATPIFCAGTGRSSVFGVVCPYLWFWLVLQGTPCYNGMAMHERVFVWRLHPRFGGSQAEIFYGCFVHCCFLSGSNLWGVVIPSICSLRSGGNLLPIGFKTKSTPSRQCKLCRRNKVTITCNQYNLIHLLFICH